MRVIQTQAYFDAFLVTNASAHVRENPGIAFAWFRSPSPSVALDNRIVAILRDYSVPLSSEARYEVTDLFLDSALRGVGFSAVARSGAISNSNVVGAIREIEVVVEQSPPVLFSLNTLLNKMPSTVAIGTFIGWQAAGSSPSLMFLTVPAGILVVGSAVGVAKALERGLNRYVGAVLEGRPPPSPRRTLSVRKPRR